MSLILVDDEDDQLAQAVIRSSANRSIAVLEKAFIRNGSGRYFVLRAHDPQIAIEGANESRDPKDSSD